MLTYHMHRNKFINNDTWCLEQLCESDALSIASLQCIIDEDVIDMDDVKSSSFFHKACYNKHITKDIINFLLDFYPEAAEIESEYYCLNRHPHEKTTTYPFHLACLNSHCDNDIVVAILKRYPPAVLHMSNIGRELQTNDYDHSLVEGLPLHYYLSRTSNVDMDIVKLLLKVPLLLLKDDPDCLRMADDDAHFAPIHVLCCNPDVNNMLDVLKFLIEKDPESVQFDGGYGQVPFLMACANTNATLTLVKVLYDLWPEAIHKQDVCGKYAMHLLSENRELNDKASEEIFHFLLQKNYGALGESNFDEHLPIHLAAGHKSPEFCRLLIDAYPESINIEADGSLPFHYACATSLRVDTVKYLYEQYPECISMKDEYDNLPIHNAAQNRGEHTSEIIKFLLMHDPEAALQRLDIDYPLYLACSEYGIALETVKVLFDDYPDAIYKKDEGGLDPIERVKRRIERDDNAKYIVEFLTEQVEYVEEARDEASFHWALQMDNISLGAVKLILKDFPPRIHTANDKGAIPLHIACQYSSVDIVKYLASIDIGDLGICDEDGKYPLHYACMGRNHDVIRYLLEKNVSSISERSTSNNMLPFHYLCLSDEDYGGNGSPKYTESLWRILSAYPDAI